MAVPKNRVRSVVWSGADPDTGTVTVVYESGPPNISPGSEDDARLQVRRFFSEGCTETRTDGGYQWARMGSS